MKLSAKPFSSTDAENLENLVDFIPRSKCYMKSEQGAWVNQDFANFVNTRTISMNQNKLFY